MGGTESGGLDRRLVAVMFTDMVGYTALMQADERLAVDKRDRYVRALETLKGARTPIRLMTSTVR